MWTHLHYSWVQGQSPIVRRCPICWLKAVSFIVCMFKLVSLKQKKKNIFCFFRVLENGKCKSYIYTSFRCLLSSISLNNYPACFWGSFMLAAFITAACSQVGDMSVWQCCSLKIIHIEGEMLQKNFFAVFLTSSKWVLIIQKLQWAYYTFKRQDVCIPTLLMLSAWYLVLTSSQFVSHTGIKLEQQSACDQ